jgi:hypothetical protein
MAKSGNYFLYARLQFSVTFSFLPLPFLHMSCYQKLYQYPSVVMLLSLVIYLRQSRRLDLRTAQSGLASLCWHLLLEYLQLFEPLSAGLNPG